MVWKRSAEQLSLEWSLYRPSSQSPIIQTLLNRPTNGNAKALLSSFHLNDYTWLNVTKS